jgi:hypothetical protein
MLDSVKLASTTSSPFLVLAAAWLGACGDSGGATATASGGGTQVTGVSTDPTMDPSNPTSSGVGASGSSGDTGDTGGTDSASGDTGDSTTASVPKLDVADGVTTGATTGEPEKGCRKVDFLFVIDNSGSMADEQQNLIASFPSFISTIQAELELASDYHIMVIDTDAYVFAQCELICPLFFNTCPMALADYTCGVTTPEECEDVLGAGVVHPKGQAASGTHCDFVSGGRYMDINEPDLTSTFACAAQVGSGSTDDPEKPMQAMVAAIAPNGAAADCNLGFLREDAILVVTFITDEDDNPGDGSQGTVDGWKASLVAAKKGDESALVVLGLFGDGDQPNSICPPFNEDQASGAEPSPRLRQFVESFGDHGIAGSVCADSYEPFFQQAVGIIDSTCDDFVPPPM